MFRLLRARGVELNILTCNLAERTLRAEIEGLGAPTFITEGRKVAWYPDLVVENYAELVKSSDVAWISDIEYLVAPRIKRLRKDIPIIAHLHSYALACPIQSALFGMRETCKVNCSQSVRRFMRCKQLSEEYQAHWDRRTGRRASSILNIPRSYVDFLRWPMNEGIINSIDGFVAVSSYTRDLVRIHLPQLNHVPIEVVHNPVILPKYSFAENGRVSSGRTILYVSGYSIGKGPHVAVYAVRKLIDEGSEGFTLTMLGGYDNAWIKSIVKELRIEKYVKVLGRLPRTQVCALMAESTVVLFPSLYLECLPTVPIESNLVGTPAIVSNRGATPDTIVDKVTGLVTEPSVGAVAKALGEGLQANWDRESIAHVAKEHFNPERSVDALQEFLQSFV